MFMWGFLAPHIYWFKYNPIYMLDILPHMHIYVPPKYLVHAVTSGEPIKQRNAQNEPTKRVVEIQSNITLPASISGECCLQMQMRGSKSQRGSSSSRRFDLYVPHEQK